MHPFIPPELAVVEAQELRRQARHRHLVATARVSPKRWAGRIRRLEA
jgi:hypothetical protein